MKPINSFIILLLFDLFHHNFVVNSCTESHTMGVHVMLNTLSYWSRAFVFASE